MNKIITFSPEEHTAMRHDYCRVNSNNKAIAYYAATDKRYLELGCGTGIFCDWASDMYRDVTGVEIDDIALIFAKNNLQPDTNITYRSDNLFDFLIGHHGPKYDVILCELLSSWLLTEPLISAMNKAYKSVLTPNGALIPCDIYLNAELGYTHLDTKTIETMKTLYEFSIPGEFLPHTQITTVHHVDLYQHQPLSPRGTTSFTAITNGILNSVRLSTIAKLDPIRSLSSTQTTMPNLIKPLIQPVNIRKFDEISVDWEVLFESNIQNVFFSI